MAQRIGVSVSTLRLYERRGLIRPKRSRGGTRDYHPEDLERFRAIADLIGVGTSIETLAQLASIRAASQSGDEAAHRVDDALKVLEAEINEQLQRLNTILLDIRSARQRLVGCHGCSAVTVQTRPLLSQARLSESFFIGGRLLGLGGSGVLYR
ncbi:MerR family transcriptional regulator [Acidithiobacillus caldus]|uniref:MerR family transcriptional regulator n=1 Tax=Acidithiobacillus caldus TaxID=33059 RepID=UPI0039896CBE